MKLYWTIIALILAGCIDTKSVTASLPERIIPYAGGLKIAGSGGQEISFYRAQTGVETAINKLVGSAVIDRQNRGTCQIVRWNTGLRLIFINNEFVGWIIGPPTWAELSQSTKKPCVIPS